MLDSKAYEQADVIGIDEAQFFGEELPRVVDEIAHTGKTVICAGLDGDINRNKFGFLIDLIPMAEKVKKMQAICVRCGSTASFTQRHTIENEKQKDTIVIVGGVEMYRPVCRVCYLEAQKEVESAKLNVHEVVGSGISKIQGVTTEKFNQTRPTLTHNLGKKRLAVQADGILPVEKLQAQIAKEADQSSGLTTKKAKSEVTALTKTRTESISLESPLSGSPPCNATEKK